MNFNEVVGKLYPQRANGVKPDKIPWSDENYVFQVKYDGDRRLLYFTKDGVKNSSRSKAKGTGLPVDKTDNVPHIRDLDIPELEGMILDCEFVHVRGFKDGVRKIMGCLPEKAIQRQEEWGAIEVRLFDIICHNGRFLHDEPWCIRNSILNAYYNKYFRDIGFIHLVEECYGTPESLQKQLNDIILNGGEGMVAKHIESKYRLSTEKCMSPLKNAWIKVKKEFNGDFVIMGFDEPTKEYTGDHLDTHQFWECGEKTLKGNYWPQYINGEQGFIPVTKLYYNNWIGAIRFGEYDNGELVERGSVSGLTEALRANISSNPDNYIGKVIELDAMERISDTKALRQPVFKGFRDDKEPEECQYENQKG
jgi:ATP-dependent DNA ligase